MVSQHLCGRYLVKDICSWIQNEESRIIELQIYREEVRDKNTNTRDVLTNHSQMVLSRCRDYSNSTGEAKRNHNVILKHHEEIQRKNITIVPKHVGRGNPFTQ